MEQRERMLFLGVANEQAIFEDQFGVQAALSLAHLDAKSRSKIDIALISRIKDSTDAKMAPCYFHCLIDRDESGIVTTIVLGALHIDNR